MGGSRECGKAKERRGADEHERLSGECCVYMLYHLGRCVGDDGQMYHFDSKRTRGRPRYHSTFLARLNDAPKDPQVAPQSQAYSAQTSPMQVLGAYPFYSPPLLAFTALISLSSYTSLPICKGSSGTAAATGAAPKPSNPTTDPTTWPRNPPRAALWSSSVKGELTVSTIRLQSRDVLP